MTLRILIADEGEARFYDALDRHALAKPRVPLPLTARLSDPSARLHDRDFKSDRPGRAFDGAPLRSGRRGATAHHGVGADRSPRASEATLFARRVAAALRLAQQRAEFDQLVLVAGPPFLGLLRTALPAALRARVVGEIHKDLVHAPQRIVREHLASMANASTS